LIHNSWIEVVGAVYLIHLAFDSLEDMPGGGSEEDDNGKPIRARCFWATVLTVELIIFLQTWVNTILNNLLHYSSANNK